MRIVVIGYTAHPFTIALLNKLQESSIEVEALVQKLKVNYSPDMVAQELTSSGTRLLKQILTVDNLKRALSNPMFTIKFATRLPSMLFRSKVLDTEAVLTESIRNKNLVVKTVDDFNSPKCERLLRSLEPDLLILGPATQIIRGGCLNIEAPGVWSVRY